MRQVTLVVPGSISARTGGSIYDRRLAQALRARGWIVAAVELDPITHPLAPPLETAPARFAAIADGAVVLVDGLAFGAMPEIVEREAQRLRLVPIVHMVLSTTPGLTPGEAGWLSNLERRALAHARHVVVTGRPTEALVAGMIGGGTRPPITRISPGTDRVETARERHLPGAPLRLLCVANLTPGKGHDIVLRALAGIAGVDWTLTCAGDPSRDRAHAQCLRALARELGVASRIDWAGGLDDEALAREYARADVFMLATRGETYAMAVAEAIAHGLPVVSTRTGEIASIAGDGAVLAAPGDAAGFAAALHDVVRDGRRRSSLGDGARQAALRLPTWDDAAESMAHVIERVGADG